MGRYQRGHLYKSFGSWHVRYRLDESVDGRLIRKQHSKRLCSDDKKKGAAERLCAEFMATINAQVPGKPEAADITVAGFWELTYLPFITDNLKPSTVYGYQQIWDSHLKEHFAALTLREYRKGMGSVFLTNKAKMLRPRTVSHIKNLASGIFTHAANLDHIESNPWRFCKVLGKTLENGKTQYYTLEEIENVISALVDHVDCQLIMALAFFLGLRKGEIQGLQWSDIDGGYVHIRRSITRGKVGTPKTKKSVRSLPIIQPVGGLLMLHRAKNPDGEYVFNRNLMTLARKTIMPTLEKAGLQWKGFHAGRRGLGTVLRSLTGNSTAGRDMLGHEDEGVTKDHYEGELPAEALKGMRLLEAAVTK
jgi:integrase